MSRPSAFPWARPSPVRLAPDERIVWQGGPTTRALAIRLYHVRFVAVYGIGLTLADAIQARLHGLGHWGAMEAAIPGILTTIGALAIFAMLAWGSARTTRYTLTERRLLMQFGLSLSATLCLPLDRIEGVAVRVRGDGTGDITVRPQANSKLVFIKLWPFVRPWRFGAPEPMLREVPAAGYVGSVLSRMVAASRSEAIQPSLLPDERPVAAPELAVA